MDFNAREILLAYRIRHGITQAALAKLLNVDQSCVSRLERGENRPRVGLAYRIEKLAKRKPK